MIQTIQTIDWLDERCLRIDFYRINFNVNVYETKFVNVNTHSFSYVHLREHLQREGDKMGFDDIK